MSDSLAGREVNGERDPFTIDLIEKSPTAYRQLFLRSPQIRLKRLSRKVVENWTERTHHYVENASTEVCPVDDDADKNIDHLCRITGQVGVSEKAVPNKQVLMSTIPPYYVKWGEFRKTIPSLQRTTPNQEISLPRRASTTTTSDTNAAPMKDKSVSIDAIFLNLFGTDHDVDVEVEKPVKGKTPRRNSNRQGKEERLKRKRHKKKYYITLGSTDSQQQVGNDVQSIVVDKQTCEEKCYKNTEDSRSPVQDKCLRANAENFSSPARQRHVSSDKQVEKSRTLSSDGNCKCKDDNLDMTRLLSGKPGVQNLHMDVSEGCSKSNQIVALSNCASDTKQPMDANNKYKSQKHPPDKIRLSSDEYDKRNVGKTLSDGSCKLPNTQRNKSTSSVDCHVIGKHRVSSKSNNREPVMGRLSAEELGAGNSHKNPSSSTSQVQSMCLPAEPERRNSHKESSDSRNKSKKDTRDKNQCDGPNSSKVTFDNTSKAQISQPDVTCAFVDLDVQTSPSGNPTSVEELKLASSISVKSSVHKSRVSGDEHERNNKSLKCQLDTRPLSVIEYEIPPQHKQSSESSSKVSKRRLSFDGPATCHKKSKMSSPPAPVSELICSSSQRLPRAEELHADRKLKKGVHNFSNKTTAVCPERRFSMDGQTSGSSIYDKSKDKSIRRKSDAIIPSTITVRKQKLPSRIQNEDTITDLDTLFKPDKIRTVMVTDIKVCATTKDSQPTEHTISGSNLEPKNKLSDKPDKTQPGIVSTKNICATAPTKDSQPTEHKISSSNLEPKHKLSDKLDKTQPVTVSKICRTAITEDSQLTEQKCSRLNLEPKNKLSDKPDKIRPGTVSNKTIYATVPTKDSQHTEQKMPCSNLVPKHKLSDKPDKTRPVTVSDMETCKIPISKDSQLTEQKISRSILEPKTKLSNKPNKIRSVTVLDMEICRTPITKDDQLAKQKVSHSYPEPQNKLSDKTAESKVKTQTEKVVRTEDKSRKGDKEEKHKEKCRSKPSKEINEEHSTSKSSSKRLETKLTSGHEHTLPNQELKSKVCSHQENKTPFEESLVRNCVTFVSGKGAQAAKQKEPLANPNKRSNADAVLSKESSAKLGEEEPRKKQPLVVGKSTNTKGKEERQSENIHLDNKEMSRKERREGSSPKGLMNGEKQPVKHDSKKRERYSKENKDCPSKLSSHKKRKYFVEHDEHSSENVLTTNTTEATSAEISSRTQNELLRSLISSPNHRKSLEDSNVMNLEFRREESCENKVIANVCCKTDFDNNILKTFVDFPVLSQGLEHCEGSLRVGDLSKNTVKDCPKVSVNLISEKTSSCTTSNTSQVPNLPTHSLDLSAYREVYTNPRLLSPIPSPEPRGKVPVVDVLRPISQEHHHNLVEVPVRKTTDISKVYLPQESVIQTPPEAELAIETSPVVETAIQTSHEAESAIQTSPVAELDHHASPVVELAVQASQLAESAVEASPVEKSSICGLQKELVDDHQQTILDASEADDATECPLMLPSPPVPYDMFMEPEYLNCSLNIGSPFPIQLNILRDNFIVDRSSPVRISEHDACASLDDHIEANHAAAVSSKTTFGQRKREATAQTSASSSDVVSATQHESNSPNVQGDINTSITQTNISNAAEGNKPADVPPQTLWGKIRCKDPKSLLIMPRQNVSESTKPPPYPLKDVSAFRVGKPKDSVHRWQSVPSQDLVVQPIHQHPSMPSLVVATESTWVPQSSVNRPRSIPPKELVPQHINQLPEIPSLVVAAKHRPSNLPVTVTSHSQSHNPIVPCNYPSPKLGTDLREMATLIIVSHRLLHKIRNNNAKARSISNQYVTTYFNHSTKLKMKNLYDKYMKHFTRDHLKKSIYEIKEVVLHIGKMCYPYALLDSYIEFVIGRLHINEFLQIHLGINMIHTQQDHVLSKSAVTALQKLKQKLQVSATAVNLSNPVTLRGQNQQSVANIGMLETSLTQTIPIHDNQYQQTIQHNSVNQTCAVPVTNQYHQSVQQTYVNQTYPVPGNDRYQETFQQTYVNRTYPAPVNNRYQQTVQQTSVNQTYPAPLNNRYQQTSVNQTYPGNQYQQPIQHSSVNQIYPEPANSQYRQSRQHTSVNATYPAPVNDQYQSTVQHNSVNQSYLVPVSSQNHLTSQSSQLQAQDASLGRFIETLSKERQLSSQYFTGALTASGDLQPINTHPNTATHSLSGPLTNNVSNQSLQIGQAGLTNIQQKPTRSDQCQQNYCEPRISSTNQNYSSLALLHPTSQILNPHIQSVNYFQSSQQPNQVVHRSVYNVHQSVASNVGSLNTVHLNHTQHYSLGELTNQTLPNNASALPQILQPINAETFTHSQLVQQHPLPSTSHFSLQSSRPITIPWQPLNPSNKAQRSVGEETSPCPSISANQKRLNSATGSLATGHYSYVQPPSEDLLCPDAIPHFATDHLDQISKAVNSRIGKMPALIPIPENFIPSPFSNIKYLPANETPSTYNEPKDSSNVAVVPQQSPSRVGSTVEAVSSTANHFLTSVHKDTSGSDTVADARSSPTQLQPDCNQSGVPVSPHAQTEVNSQRTRAEANRLLSPHTGVAEDFQRISTVACLPVSPHGQVAAGSPSKEAEERSIVLPHVQVTAGSPSKEAEERSFVSPYVQVAAGSPSKEAEERSFVSPYVQVAAGSPSKEAEERRLVSPHVQVTAGSPRKEAEERSFVSPYVQVAAGSPSKEAEERRLVSPHVQVTAGSPRKEAEERSFVSPYVQVAAGSPSKEAEERSIVSPYVQVVAGSPSKEAEERSIVSPHVQVAAGSLSKEAEEKRLVSPHVQVAAGSPSKEAEERRLVSPHVQVAAGSPSKEAEERLLVSPDIEAVIDYQQKTLKQAYISPSTKTTANLRKPKVDEASSLTPEEHAAIEHQKLLDALLLLEEIQAAKLKKALLLGDQCTSGKQPEKDLKSSASVGSTNCRASESNSKLPGQDADINKSDSVNETIAKPQTKQRVSSSLVFKPTRIKSESGLPFVVIPANNLVTIANIPAFIEETIPVTKPATAVCSESPSLASPKKSKNIKKMLNGVQGEVSIVQKPPIFTEGSPSPMKSSEHTASASNVKSGNSMDAFETSSEKWAGTENTSKGYTRDRCPMIASKMHAYKKARATIEAKKKVKKSQMEIEKSCMETYSSISKELLYNQVATVPHHLLEVDDDEEEEAEEDSQRLVIDLASDCEDFGFYAADEEMAGDNPDVKPPNRVNERNVRTISRDSGFQACSPTSPDPMPYDFQNCDYCILEMVDSKMHLCLYCDKQRYCSINCRENDWVLKHHSDCENVP